MSRVLRYILGLLQGPNAMHRCSRIRPIASALLAMASAPALSADLCAGGPNTIVPDMRIREADLTRQAAIDATASLRRLIRDDAMEGEGEIGTANAQTIIRGYVLRRAAEHARMDHGVASVEARDATDRFCRWLAEDGAWHD